MLCLGEYQPPEHYSFCLKDMERINHFVLCPTARFSIHLTGRNSEGRRFVPQMGILSKHKLCDNSVPEHSSQVTQEWDMVCTFRKHSRTPHGSQHKAWSFYPDGLCFIWVIWNIWFPAYGFSRKEMDVVIYMTKLAGLFILNNFLWSAKEAIVSRFRFHCLIWKTVPSRA